MGKPILCPDCNTKNGILHEECRLCGKIISRTGKCSRIKVLGKGVPSAFWETEIISDLWRRSSSIKESVKPLSMHDFLEYCLLLEKMQKHFDQDDRKIWFDEVLFFLRGGYDFWMHLNTSSDMTLRGRIFGGLNHASRPKDKLKDWLHKILDEANAKKHSIVDVFVADEINSGSGTRQFMNLINKELKKITHYPNRITLNFMFYLAYTDIFKFSIGYFFNTIRKKKNRSIRSIDVNYRFRFFKSKIIGYDTVEYSGIKVIHRKKAKVEKYKIKKYVDPTYHLFCPSNKHKFHSCKPNSDPVPHGISILELMLFDRIGPVYANLRREIREYGCDKCKSLFSR